MLTIVTVLKTGVFDGGYYKKPYKKEFVQRIQKQLEKYVTVPYRFVCLSDVKIDGVETIPLNLNVDGWWNKIQVFKEFTDFLYLDLDITILQNIDEIINTKGDFIVYEDYCKKGELNSSIMRVRGDYSFIYYYFNRHKEIITKEYTTAKRWGDQKFIEDMLHDNNKSFSFYPKKHFINYRFETMRGKQKNNEHKVMVFAGSPKPWDLENV